MAQFDADFLAQQFSKLIGSKLVRTPRERECAIAEIVIEPETREQIREIVRKCEADRITLAPLGGGRTLAFIRPDPVGIGISLARMSRVVDYQPADMTIVAEAGVTLDALNRAMSACNQRLPIDPAHPDRSTLGATIAAAKAGPLRLSEGAIRDLLIGISFVGSGGRLAHAGGRVVKNVAGYDLMKVMTGAYGTLGIIVEAVCKVRPLPENYALVITSFSALPEAFNAANQIAEAVALSHCEIVKPDPDERHVLHAGFSGIAPEMAYQRDKIQALLGAAQVVENADAIVAYEDLRDWPANDYPVAAQLAVKPSELARSLVECGATRFRTHALNGVAQLYDDDGFEAAAKLARWRTIAHRGGGHLRVLAAPSAARANVEFFDDPPAPAFALMRRLKASFDPRRIFNPGCFVGGL